ncbi:hypothetical protein GO998_07675 [Ralstonia syzygii]|uniref:Abasic site processing protein n=1 Tax=Ralstonia syzygii TaxID=28097 RepID=A0ABX7ZIX3_9RALS|nr:hypothetical protein GO998_07675 [Ralstonia syzygii]
MSLAIITDDPPPKIAESGHDRCPVPVKPESIDAWLNPSAQNLECADRILGDRVRPYYQHRVAE